MRQELVAIAERVGVVLKEREWRLTTAESCTGGVISMALCATKDSGDFYTGGFVTYTNRAKIKLLHVRKETLDRYTAVSRETVSEMALGALKIAEEEVSLAVSGYAGLEGGADGTPAGTLWFAWSILDNVIAVESKQFQGDDEEVIYQSACYALENLISLIKKLPPSNV
ncbi:nicotinamide-nucleotide amidohydrolase family protein [Serratia quinivorans]|uniref:nicotinamide-nucleotide amidohydrolase family protein n=1 Tax=Serratia quinivorans TaxID=137545 RepID=UPI003F995D95